VATVADPGAVAAVRFRHAPDPSVPLVGHFGTFGRLIAELLEPAIIGLFRSIPCAQVLLIGRRSERFHAHFSAAYPNLGGRLRWTGELPPSAVAAHLRACDLLLQPYPDGVSSRRGSVMAGLANGVPVVTNLGHLSEALWATAAGVEVIPSPDPAALAATAAAILALPPEGRLALAARGAELYRTEFALERTIARLREPTFARPPGETPCRPAAGCCPSPTRTWSP
jgi:glycosyltransferase involved in cell wall biosynthesis